MANKRIRKFVGGGSRPDRNRRKREEATIRNVAWAELSPERQLAALDAKFGTGLGATKQRARLAKSRAA